MAEVAHGCWNDGTVDLLMWIVAKSRDQIATQYAPALAGVTGTTDESEELAAERFLAWLSTTTRPWLDNLVNPGNLRHDPHSIDGSRCDRSSGTPLPCAPWSTWLLVEVRRRQDHLPSARLVHVLNRWRELVIMERRSRDAVLMVTGEIDMSTAGVFEEAMLTALHQAPTGIIVDLSGVRFMDSSGIAALVNTHRRSVLTRSTLSVVNCQPNVRQVMEITEVYDILTRPSTPQD